VPDLSPQVILRLGAHSEKEYIEKTIQYFDGVIVGANLLEATPGATASLVFKLYGKGKRPYFIDPMTYAFGAYEDPSSGEMRTDLDWIKSEQKVRGGKKGETKRDFKSSYRKLSIAFGTPFSEALERAVAVNESDLSTERAVDGACKSVLDYQETRLQRVFREDKEAAPFADDLPSPAVLFAPYFYIEKTHAEELIRLNHALGLSSTRQSKKIPVHIVLCANRGLLTDARLSNRVIGNLKDCTPAGVWLWFSRFDEHLASKDELTAMRWWVEQLAPSMAVFNMHGSFFSLALSKVGMSGIAHGVGYGEQKNVVPVIGQSTPTVQYYVRSLHTKYSVPIIERSFSALGIETSDDFLSKVCDCLVCREIIGPNLNAFAQFGEIHYSTPISKRAAQTPAAAKRCRFHYLLNRFKEREYVRNASLADIAKGCDSVADEWSKTLVSGEIAHLKRWAKVLKSS